MLLCRGSRGLDIIAVLLDAPFETNRPLDADRRHAPPALLERAERVLDQHRRATGRFTLDTLADAFAIHPREQQRVMVVPTNFASRLIGLRLRLHLTQSQDGTATRVGAPVGAIAHSNVTVPLA
jgi:hypothetical protein